MGSDVVAYKRSSMYLGRYVGPPLVWTWQRVPGDVGCAGPEALVVVDSVHYFVGPSDFYVYDGTVPRPIGGAVREWFFSRLDEANRDKIYGIADPPRGLIYWHYPSTASGGVLDSVLIYNYRTDRWGKQSLTVGAPVQYSSGQITYDSLGTPYATYNDLPNIAYDSSFWLSNATVPAVFVGNSLFSINGEPGASWLQTGDIGDITNYTMLKRVTPRYSNNPTTATGTNYYRASLGEQAEQDATAPLTRNRLDFRRTALWHSLRIDHTGPAEINGLDVELTGAGRE